MNNPHQDAIDNGHSINPVYQNPMNAGAQIAAFKYRDCVITFTSEHKTAIVWAVGTDKRQMIGVFDSVEAACDAVNNAANKPRRLGDLFGPKE